MTIEALPNPDVMTRAAVRPARVYRVAGLAVLLIAASALPFFISDYRTFQFTLTICYAITLLGLNILTGYNGQISLGHGAFFAIGAYTAAIMMDRWDLPYWSTIPAAGLVCLGAGFLFGLPALRLEGLYLALATFALAVATPQILKYKGIEAASRGSSSSSPRHRSACRSARTSGSTCSRSPSPSRCSYWVSEFCAAASAVR